MSPTTTSAETNEQHAAGTIGELLVRLTRARLPEQANARARLWELARWPPDAFAFTSLALADSGAYRVAVEPAPHARWPPRKGKHWNRWVERVGFAWRRSSTSRKLTKSVAALVRSIARNASVPVRELGDPQHWDLTAQILELHAMADEASFELGLPSDVRGEPLEEVLFRHRANRQLRRGTVSEVPTEIVRVLPKMRTAQAGITLRSMSHQLAIDRSEVDVRWYSNPFCDDARRTLNLLLVPWPLEVHPCDFTEAKGRLLNMPKSKFGFFDFSPRAKLNPGFVSALIERAKTTTGDVDGVVFPELAVTPDQVRMLQAELRELQVPFLLAGVRDGRRNYANLSLHSSGEWSDYPQHKHHRWSLDATQIRDYHLGAALHPSRRWWENTEVRRRELHVVAVNSWLAIAPLICEDLARQDPVAQLIRSIGPTLVIALLLDGPQLGMRWPARYAAVLADDPGSSVLTLSSYGMVKRSVPPNGSRSDVVALWKDPLNGARELQLPSDASALLITLSAHMVREFAADGRSDGTKAAQLVLSAVQPISGK